MTYFGFLILFLVLPIIALGIVHIRDQRQGKLLPVSLRGWSAVRVLALLVGIALIYTTPWDNYLVATSVWWYDPARVFGITFGWVPLEEYLFFVLEPVLVGLWALFLARRLNPASEKPARPGKGWLVPLLVAGCWIAGVVMLLARWQPGTYLGLELAWGLPPILLQLGFGLDILVRQRRLVLLTILSTTLYLSAADLLAIQTGIWTIDPQQSMNLMLFGRLPVEEFVFFLITTTLVTCGLVLGIASQSRQRSHTLARQITRRDTQQS